LADFLATLDYKSFWRELARRAGRAPIPEEIDSARGKDEIAEMWANHFAELFSQDILVSQDELPHVDLHNVGTVITGELVAKAIRSLRLTAAPGPDGLMAQHLRFAPPIINEAIAELINGMLEQGAVPPQMMMSSIKPLMKKSYLDPKKSKNYRAISLNNLLFKLTEVVFLEILQPHLWTSDNQCAYKCNSDTNIAVLLVSETVRYYNHLGSPVYAAFLDASQAFDRVDHDLLFAKLSARGAPTDLVQVLSQAYKTQRSSVKWDNFTSRSFPIRNGVRQGGILSPHLFSVYTHDLISALLDTTEGCTVGAAKMGVIAYADDLALLSPTREGLQHLLDTALENGEKIGLRFNAEKSAAMLFSGRTGMTTEGCVVNMNTTPLAFLSKLNYSGHVITTKNDCREDMLRARRSIYGAYNSALRPFHSANAASRITIFGAHCAHLFGCELWTTSRGSAFKDTQRAFDNCMKGALRIGRRCSTTWAAMEANLLPFRLLLARRRLAAMLRWRQMVVEPVKAILRTPSCAATKAWREDIVFLDATSWHPETVHELDLLVNKKLLHRAAQLLDTLNET
jgi:hypothetical protein